MPTSLRTLTLSFTALCIVALSSAAFMVQAASEPDTTTEYADTATEYDEYRNDHWHFSLAIPADMKVTEFKPDRHGQQIIEVTDATRDKEILITARPYTQLDVTLGRLGDPSSTSDQPDHLEIVDVMRDDTFIVAFRKNGVRYAVRTLQEDEAWLIDILTGWQFTE